MATIRFDQVPYVVEITNNAKEIPAEDAGSAQRKKAYIDTNRSFQFYKTNTWVTIAKGDTVKLVAETSEEAAYFASLATDDLAVVLTGAASDEATE